MAAEPVVKTGPGHWSHGWVWHGPRLPPGAPPQARLASGAKPPAGQGKPAASAGSKPAGKPAAKPAAKPQAKPAAATRPGPGSGHTPAQQRQAQAHELHEQATGLRNQAHSLDLQAHDLEQGLRAAQGRRAKNTTRRRRQPAKPASRRKPARSSPRRSTVMRIATLRLRARTLRTRATTLDHRARQILTGKATAAPDLTKSDTSRRHVAKAITDELTYVSFPITKFEKTDDGDLIVIGKATDGSVDSDEQIVDPDWSAKALADWLDTGGNVRVQHQAMRDPAGKGLSVEIDRDGDGGHWVKSLVVEPVAKRLVEKGVLTAYSVGIARPVITRDPSMKARGGIVTGGSLAELSLVDRPANKNCGLMIAKAAGGSGEAEGVGAMFGDPEFLAKASTEEELLTKTAGVDDGQDGDDGQGGTASSQQADEKPEDDEGAEGDAAVSKAVDPATAAGYKAERQAWLASEPSVKNVAGGTEYLAKVGEWKRWEAHGAAEGLDGTADGAARWLAKRDFSAAERGQAADSGAAMGDGSFPIKTVADLGNAIHLAGHAKDPAAARAHIKRRAAALGASDKIPDSWKTETADALTPADLVKTIAEGTVAERDAQVLLGPDAWNAVAAALDPDAVKAAAADGTVGDSGSSMSSDGNACATCKGTGKIRGGNVPCPDCSAGSKAEPEPDAAEVAEPDQVKGTKDCGSCGASYDSDTSARFCGGCGRKLPSAKKAARAALKAAEAVHEVAVADLAATVTKSVAVGLMSQEDADAVIAQAVATAGGSKANAPLPPDTHPAGTHREPDGRPIEALESDAGMRTEPDGKFGPGESIPSLVIGSMSGKGEAAPYELGRMHDVMCAAFPPAESLAEYPTLKSAADAVDAGWITAEATAALQAGDAAKTAALAGLLGAAQSLKAADPAAVADGMAHLHKSFTDMYPNERISPSAPRMPGSFQRPYLTQGHAAENAERNGGDNIPPSSHTPEPEDFHRPLITTGHAADSPANKAGDIRNDAPVRTGASRTYYSNAQREAARVALASLHDHIAGNFPDLCPMAASKSVIPPHNGADNVPHATPVASQGGIRTVGKNTATVAPAAVDGADLQQLIADSVARYTARNGGPAMSVKQLRKAAARLGLDVTEKAAQTIPAPVGTTHQERPAGLSLADIKSLLTEHLNPLTQQVDDRISTLQKQLDEIGSQPDPAMAPVRGALARAPQDTPPAPVERRNLVDEAAATAARKAQDDESRYREYVGLLTKSPDPGVRERALAVLDKMAPGNPAA